MGETVCEAVGGADDLELAGRADPGPPLTEAPPEVAGQTVRWRVVRIESDLKSVETPQPRGAAPPPGQ